jgi:hypothetical protein
VNVVQALCTYVCERKVRPVENTPGTGEEGMEENDGKGEFK